MNISVFLLNFRHKKQVSVDSEKNFRHIEPGREVRINKNGNRVILEPLENSWELLFSSLPGIFPDQRP